MSVVAQFIQATEVDNNENDCKKRPIYFVE